MDKQKSDLRSCGGESCSIKKNCYRFQIKGVIKDSIGKAPYDRVLFTCKSFIEAGSLSQIKRLKIQVGADEKGKNSGD